MKLALRPAVLLLGCVAAGLPALGCGAKHVPVKGRLTYKGQPLRGSDQAPLQVSFCPVVDGQDQFAAVRQATVNQQDGTFEVPGGLPAGTYRIAVRREDASTLTDTFEERFGEGQSPVVREVGGGQEVVIDLADPAG